MVKKLTVHLPEVCKGDDVDDGDVAQSEDSLHWSRSTQTLCSDWLGSIGVHNEKKYIFAFLDDLDHFAHKIKSVVMIFDPLHQRIYLLNFLES